MSTLETTKICIQYSNVWPKGIAVYLHMVPHNNDHYYYRRLLYITVPRVTRQNVSRETSRGIDQFVNII